MQGAQAQSLAGELRSRMPRGMDKNKNKPKTSHRGSQRGGTGQGYLHPDNHTERLEFVAEFYHSLMSSTTNVTLLVINSDGKGNFADGPKVTNQLTLKWGDYPGLAGWVPWNHVSPEKQKRKAE